MSTTPTKTKDTSVSAMDVEIDEKALTPTRENVYPVENDPYAFLDEEREFLPGDPLYIDPKEEAALVRKMDLYLAPIIMIVYTIAALDRGNIGNAAAAGMSTAIGLKGNELSVCVSIYYVTYVLCEIPVSLAIRRFQPRITVPTIMLVWAAIMIGSGFMKNYAGLIVTRLLIGLMEAGLFPFLTVYLSGFYKRRELSRRTACLFLSLMFSGAVGGLLASAFLQMDGVGGKPGWQWLYIMEAVISVAIAIPVYFLLPNEAKTAWFLTPRQREVFAIRELQRAQYMGGKVLTRPEFNRTFKDPKVYMSGWIQFTCDICLYGFSSFLPVIISGLGEGYTGVRAQLLTVPVYAAAAVAYIITAYFMDRCETRLHFMIPAMLLNMVGYAVLLGVAEDKNNVKYAMTFLVAIGLYIADGGNMTLLNINHAPQMKRSVAVAFQQSMGNSGGIVAGQIYRTQDKPQYMLGHGVSLGSMSCSLLGACVLFWWIRRTNMKRDRLTEEERRAWIDAGAIGDAHPDFRLKF
ncbi:major facilitator superfamily domain-containing protein [Naematelia encephala]|uniref:Major facilitator superfamily domain-containing protein n=1 Tax=Naematelia encephala TaxID=71784 RepID=A0A1Y2BJW1_9TREE|nr:major facilitator superfamily domain-containing protein [Naematelia encephala]